jgi:hypothetical protein
LHLLLLHHPARDDFVDRKLHERGRDWFDMPPAGAVVDQRGLVGFEVINQIFQVPP